MRKLLPIRSKIQYSLLIFGLLLISSCKKTDLIGEIHSTDDLKKTFFATGDKMSNDIISLSKALENEKGFKDQVVKFAKINGIPKWDKVVYHSGGNVNSKGFSVRESKGGIFFIPLANSETGEIQSYIAGKKNENSDYKFQLYNKDTLNSIKPKNQTQIKQLKATYSIFAYFEQTINNKSGLKINNPSVSSTLTNVSLSFGPTNENAIGKSNGANKVKVVVTKTCQMVEVNLVYYDNGEQIRYHFSVVFDCGSSIETYYIDGPADIDINDGGGSGFPSSGPYYPSGGSNPAPPAGSDPSGGGSGSGNSSPTAVPWYNFGDGNNYNPQCSCDQRDEDLTLWWNDTIPDTSKYGEAQFLDAAGAAVLQELEHMVQHDFIGTNINLPIDFQSFANQIVTLEYSNLNNARVHLIDLRNANALFPADDPWLEWIREKLRQYFRLSEPKTPEEALEMEQKRQVLITQLSHWKMAADVQKEAFKLMPGVSSIIDTYEGNFGSAATAAALDLFGASIVKAPFKVGISLIRVSELGLRMPIIANALKNAGVLEFKILRNSFHNKYAVVGQSMERIMTENNTGSKYIFDEVFGTSVATFKCSPEALAEWNLLTNGRWLTELEIKSTKMWQENVEWVLKMKSEGYNFIDIGRDYTKSARGYFYDMERKVIYK